MLGIGRNMKKVEHAQFTTYLPRVASGEIEFEALKQYTASVIGIIRSVCAYNKHILDIAN